MVWRAASAKCWATRVRSLAIRDGKTTMTGNAKNPQEAQTKKSGNKTLRPSGVGGWRHDGDAWKVVAETNHRLKQLIFGGFQSSSIALEEFHDGFACCICWYWRVFVKRTQRRGTPELFTFFKQNTEVPKIQGWLCFVNKSNDIKLRFRTFQMLQRQ